MKATTVKIYNTVSKTEKPKTFKSKKDARNWINSQNRFNKINNLTNEYYMYS